jgi:hypothetical protein
MLASVYDDMQDAASRSARCCLTTSPIDTHDAHWLAFDFGRDRELKKNKPCFIRDIIEKPHTRSQNHPVIGTGLTSTETRQPC